MAWLNRGLTGPNRHWWYQTGVSIFVALLVTAFGLGLLGCKLYGERKQQEAVAGLAGRDNSASHTT